MMTKELIEFEKQAAIAAMQTLIRIGEKNVEGKAMGYAVSLVEEYKRYHPTVNDGDFVAFAVQGEGGRGIAIMKDDNEAHIYVWIENESTYLITPSDGLKDDFERYSCFLEASDSEKAILLTAMKEKGLNWDSVNKKICLIGED